MSLRRTGSWRWSFCLPSPPVGVLMIALRLFGGGKRRVAQGRHPYYMQRDGQAPWGLDHCPTVQRSQKKDRPEGEKSARKGKRNRICPRCAWT